MAKLPEWKISFLKGPDGTDPFSDFASRLPTPGRIEWEAVIRLLQEFGTTLQGDRMLVHKYGLYEFKGDEVRIFFKRIGPTEIRIDAGLITSDSEDLVERIVCEAKNT